MPIVLTLVWTGLFGAAIGSFLNVCIYRLPRECMSLVWPGSRCPKCLRPIRWFDNVPILSWVLLGGRCRACKSPISIRYPFIELLTGCLFAFAAWHQLFRAPLSSVAASLALADRTLLFLVYAYLLAALIVSTFIDFDFRIIPDQITLSGAYLAPVVAALFPVVHADAAAGFQALAARLFENGSSAHALFANPRVAAVLSSLFGMLCGGGLIYAMGVFGKILFRKEAMGFGDVKYMCLLGGFMGWKAALLILALACLFGAGFGIFIKLFTRDPYIAFGPYLSLGALCLLFWQAEIVEFLFTTWPAWSGGLLRAGPGGGPGPGGS
ncbi:MAG: prepilin peptidase [Planctomycetes bacterium]|nr:prepilin peptidase [Planctomycetota bacterium]